jgi:hypothetical protein
MVAATVTATMTFQLVINPQGGVWQEDTTTGAVYCPHYGFCQAGTSQLYAMFGHKFISNSFL